MKAVKYQIKELLLQSQYLSNKTLTKNNEFVIIMISQTSIIIVTTNIGQLLQQMLKT
jgi:hypothetical protein